MNILNELGKLQYNAGFNTQLAQGYSRKLAEEKLQKQQLAMDDIYNIYQATKKAMQPSTQANLNSIDDQANLISQLSSMKQQYEANPQADQGALDSLSAKANDVRTLYKTRYGAELPGADASYQSMAPQVTGITNERQNVAQDLLALSKLLYGNRFDTGKPEDALVNAKNFLGSVNQDYTDPLGARVKMQSLVSKKYGPDVAGKAIDSYDTLSRNDALAAFMQNPNTDTAAAAMRTGVDVTKLTGLTPKTSTYDVNTGDASKLYAVKTQPFGGQVSRELVGADSISLSPGQKQQGSQFEQNITLDKQKLGMQRLSLERDWFDRDRQFNLDVQKIGNDNVKQYVSGKHEQLRSLTSDASGYLKMAENELDPKQKTQYYQAAQDLLAQSNLVRNDIDRVVSSWVPGSGSSGQTSGSNNQNSSGKITDAEYDAIYNKLVFEHKMSPEQAQAYIKKNYW